jgi:hypothetical protein
MTFTRGRRRHVETTGHFCPHAACAYHGRVDWGNIRANGHPNGHRWRQLCCLSCKGYFLETLGTPFHAKQVEPDKLVWAIAALVTHYGQWTQSERRQGKGPRPQPRWMPQPRLLYAQVVKSYRRQRIVGIKHRVIFGAAQTIESILAKRGWQINTSFVERLNLDLRQHVAAIGHRVNTLCKHEAGLRHQLALFQTYHNLCCLMRACVCPCPKADYSPRPARASGGGWTDGSRVKSTRRAAVPGTTVVANPCRVSMWDSGAR